jgi:hypothetical protein
MEFRHGALSSFDTGCLAHCDGRARLDQYFMLGPVYDITKDAGKTSRYVVLLCLLSPWCSPIGALLPRVRAPVCFWQRPACYLSTSHGGQASRIRSGRAKGGCASLLAALQQLRPPWGSLARRLRKPCKMAGGSRAAATPRGPYVRCPVPEAGRQGAGACRPAARALRRRNRQPCAAVEVHTSDPVAACQEGLSGRPPAGPRWAPSP